MPSFVISSHEVSPLATEIVTTVSVAFVESPAVLSESAVPLVVVVVVGVDEVSVDVELVELVSVDVVLTGTVVLLSWDVERLLTHERTEKTRMRVSANARAQITRSVARRLSWAPRPRACPERRQRWSSRRRTLGLSTLAIFLDERLPEMVDARS
jgi:hypothetical protein